MTTAKSAIDNCLKQLESNNSNGQIHVKFDTENDDVWIYQDSARSAKFWLDWQDDHYVGYFAAEQGEDVDTSQAVLALWNADEAKVFVETYTNLLSLKAGRRSPN
jgi:hypothetical protein